MHSVSSCSIRSHRDFRHRPTTAAATRHRLLPRLAREHVLIATPHSHFSRPWIACASRSDIAGAGVFTDQWARDSDIWVEHEIQNRGPGRYQNARLRALIGPCSAVEPISGISRSPGRTDAVIERLLPFDIICVMRERTPLPRNVVERLPNLKLIASTGPGTPRSTSLRLPIRDVVSHTGYRSDPTIDLTWRYPGQCAQHRSGEQLAAIRRLAKNRWYGAARKDSRAF